MSRRATILSTLPVVLPGGVMVLAALIGNGLPGAWRRPAATTNGEMSL